MRARRRLFHYALLGVLSLVFLGPLLFMISASFKPDEQIFEDLQSFRAFVPVGDITLDNYRAVFEQSRLLLYFLNSSIIAIVTVVFGVIVNSMCAFGLQRVRWTGQSFIVALILALLVIPFEVLAIPLMMIVSQLPWIAWHNGELTLLGSWFNSLHVQIIPFLGNAFCIFLFYQFFKDIPTDLDDAARMDGASLWQIYWRILMPNAKPVIATASIILFLIMWNQYLWPILVIQGQDTRPIMVGIQQFFGRTLVWGQIMAYATIVTLPVLAVFVFFQRRFVQSVANTGLKG
ncbi:MAG: carbohydrate ABC transporter permease [Pseudomonadota bacterium]